MVLEDLTAVTAFLQNAELDGGGTGLEVPNEPALGGDLSRGRLSVLSSTGMDCSWSSNIM